MDSRTVFRKTEKGNEAIGARAHGVAGKLRMLLILVDGKKNAEELVRLAAGLGESADLLKQLQAQGLIESASAEAAAGAPARPDGGGVNLA